MQSRHFLLMMTMVSCVGCNIQDTAAPPCVDGDRRGETVCVGGRFVTVDMDMSAEMDAPVDLVADLVDITEDVPVDMGEMSMDDMGPDLCTQDITCAMVECGPTTDACGGDVDCGDCSTDEVCQDNTCMCPEPSCQMRCGVVSNACGGMRDCGTTCGFGTTCEANQCVVELALKSRTGPMSSFGASIAQHGEWLAIGSPTEMVNGNANVGVVDLFRWSGGTWKFDRQLKGDNKANSYFGYSVDIHKKYLVVGAPGDNTQRGRVFVFRDSAIAPWNASDTITGEDKARFGESVAIVSEAGSMFTESVIAVGAPDDGEGTITTYSCRFLGSCDRDERFAATEGRRFGLSLAGDVDKKLVVAGQTDFGLNGRSTGRAVVLDADAKPIATYQPATTDGQQQHGHAVKILGEIVVAGAPNKTVNGVGGAGAVYVHNPSGMMVTSRVDSPAPKVMGQFGFSVDLKVIDNNTFFVVGAPGQKTVFAAQQMGAQGLGNLKPLPPATDATDQFGKVVHVAVEQKQILVGDPGSGKVYIYQIQ